MVKNLDIKIGAPALAGEGAPVVNLGGRTTFILPQNLTGMELVIESLRQLAVEFAFLERQRQPGTGTQQ